MCLDYADVGLVYRLLSFGSDKTKLLALDAMSQRLALTSLSIGLTLRTHGEIESSLALLPPVYLS